MFKIYRWKRSISWIGRKRNKCFNTCWHAHTQLHWNIQCLSHLFTTLAQCLNMKYSVISDNFIYYCKNRTCKCTLQIITCIIYFYINIILCFIYVCLVPMFHQHLRQSPDSAAGYHHVLPSQWSSSRPVSSEGTVLEWNAPNQHIRPVLLHASLCDTISGYDLYIYPHECMKIATDNQSITGSNSYMM